MISLVLFTLTAVTQQANAVEVCAIETFTNGPDATAREQECEAETQGKNKLGNICGCD